MPTDSTRRLARACQVGDVEAVRAAVARKDCDVNWQSEEQGRTPIILAVDTPLDEDAAIAIVHILADAGANMNSVSNAYQTALYRSTHFHRGMCIMDNRVALALVGRGADPEGRYWATRPYIENKQVLVEARRLEKERQETLRWRPLAYVWLESNGAVIRSLSGDELTTVPHADCERTTLRTLRQALPDHYQAARLFDGKSGSEIHGVEGTSVADAISQHAPSG